MATKTLGSSQVLYSRFYFILLHREWIKLWHKPHSCSLPLRKELWSVVTPKSNSVVIYSKVLPNPVAWLTKLELLINIRCLKELWPTDTWHCLASLSPTCVTSAHFKGNKEPDCLLIANGGSAMPLPDFYLLVHQNLDKGNVQPTGQLPKRSNERGQISR